MRKIFEDSSFNTIIPGSGSLGIITGGVSYRYVREALEALGLELPVCKIGTPHPMPTNKVLEFIEPLDQVLVIEEQEPVLEDQIIKLILQQNKFPHVRGKHDRLVPREGELNVNKVVAILSQVLEISTAQTKEAGSLQLPIRPPVLCAGCPHRASFYAFKQAADKEAIFTGDIGCYTLGNMAPLDAVDTCLCMGAGISLGAGLQRAEKQREVIAFIGDSTFFHSGITGLINAVHNNSNITVVVLDNRTTAMTGHQSHPGLNRTATGDSTIALNIVELAKACGVRYIKEVDPYDYVAAVEVAREALKFEGVSVVVMKRECIALIKGNRKSMVIDEEKCIGCGFCVEELGCPAISRRGETPVIEETCNGCNLCGQICPAEAIVERGVVR